MLIQGNNSTLNYQACLCNVSGGITNAYGYLNTSIFPQQGTPAPTIAQVQLDRYNSIYAATVPVNRNCYICTSEGDPTPYEPCDAFLDCKQSNMLGFRPASISSQQCDTQTAAQSPASILVSSTVTERATVLGVLYAVSVAYLIQLLGALACFVAFYMYKDKYGSDWAKLTRVEYVFGVLAKCLPSFTRIINVICIIFLVIASVSVFENSVCKYDTDAFNNIVFYPTITAFTIFVGLSWLFTCVLGVIVQKYLPRDTSFYAPEFPTDKNANFCARCCASMCFVLTNYGP